MTERGKLYFCVGLPRSGKSTYCQHWVKTLGLVTPRVVISGDAFRQGLHGHAYLPEAEGQVFAAMDTAIRALLLSGFDVIVDETSTTPETIRRYLKIDVNAEPVFIDTPVEVCIERALATDKPYLVEPIKRMHAQMVKLKANWVTTFEELKAYARTRQNHDIHV